MEKNLWRVAKNYLFFFLDQQHTSSVFRVPPAHGFLSWCHRGSKTSVKAMCLGAVERRREARFYVRAHQVHIHSTHTRASAVRFPNPTRKASARHSRPTSVAVSYVYEEGTGFRGTPGARAWTLAGDQVQGCAVARTGGRRSCSRGRGRVAPASKEFRRRRRRWVSAKRA